MERKSLSNNIFFHFSINSSIAKSYTKQRAPEEVVEMADHSDAGAALFIFFVYYFFWLWDLGIVIWRRREPLALPALYLL
jgi:hypothetical protein